MKTGYYESPDRFEVARGRRMGEGNWWQKRIRRAEWSTKTSWTQMWGASKGAPDWCVRARATTEDRDFHSIFTSTNGHTFTKPSHQTTCSTRSIGFNSMSLSIRSSCALTIHRERVVRNSQYIHLLPTHAWKDTDIAPLTQENNKVARTRHRMAHILS